MNMNTNLQNMIGYLIVLLATGIAAYLKWADPTLFLAALAGVSGHFLGANSSSSQPVTPIVAPSAAPVQQNRPPAAG